ncbi:6-pyruvoyl trahydropterin synthase family protein [Thiosocius teredinicola]|uniref:6-pyruvoyl trahydropterin synthase family protein n=1 Tax=Thiosocius teredinicola TaxID=1973002 RepID=UPI0009911BEC
MQCLECGADCDRLDNEHLIACSGLTLQEYAIRHCLPLDLVVHADQINQADDAEAYDAPRACPGEEARTALQGLRWAGLICNEGEFSEVRGEIRRLDMLLWLREQLHDYGFQFRQDYTYSPDTHRVVARNCVRVPTANLKGSRHWAVPEPPPDFLDCLAIYFAHQAEWHNGYLFMPFDNVEHAQLVAETLLREHGIASHSLDAVMAGGRLLRSKQPRDADALLALLASRLQEIPSAWERFHQTTPVTSVSKELVFDAAHFIIDHPAKCSNLHGGRYVLHVEVRDRIDPVTGCVVDYGYLKRVVNQQVVDRFDHHNLNYAAPELAWRSSTEMLCVHIWECLIDYLPGLASLRLYETTQSWCDYTGPTLEACMAQGSDPVLHPFDRIDPHDGRRRGLIAGGPALRAVAGNEVR